MWLNLLHSWKALNRGSKLEQILPLSSLLSLYLSPSQHTRREVEEEWVECARRREVEGTHGKGWDWRSRNCQQSVMTKRWQTCCSPAWVNGEGTGRKGSARVWHAHAWEGQKGATVFWWWNNAFLESRREWVGVRKKCFSEREWRSLEQKKKAKKKGDKNENLKMGSGNIQIYYQSECKNKTKETVVDFSHAIDRFWVWVMLTLHVYVHLWHLCNHRVRETEWNSA